MTATIGWAWQRSEAPPAPLAVVAWHAAADGLLHRLMEMDDAALAPLQATACGSALVVAADRPEALPWSPGVAYAAPCDADPALWLPTLWVPDVPLDLLAHAMHQRHRRRPLLLWPDPAAVVPLDRMLPASGPMLARIQAHRSGASVEAP
ncbi:hypothetical protein AACH06_01855 [Ideonella sp. DXS29W]|uniref:MoxR-vWA-beta-propeller ternary system domain-containing protein n=1 Tax=Ideonella lacteola TaxID=2984193 RepID=A0ABU9BL08_9BURK